MPKQLLLLELNEINFEDVGFYCAKGFLPNFAELFARNGWAYTTSESNYSDIEPWIQWVTAHTGKSLAEHGVFRLGDIVLHDAVQIWEELESHGLTVGAISPMNAKHRVQRAAFFVPDPWTRTELTARRRLRGLYAAIAQAVNDNSESRLTARSAGQMALGLCSFARLRHYPLYWRLATTTRNAPWRRAILLDLLLADVFMSEVGRTRPNFATLFLNAGAHIQHHYLYSAASYEGPHRNPDWYIRPGADPVLEVYKLYDEIIAAVRTEFPDARFMIATGLHQVPHGEVTYYWRLRDHEQFLRRLGVPFIEIEPRMSRDFLVRCESASQAIVAEQRLKLAKTAEGEPFFEVDNRGTDLFVMLTYPREIRHGLRLCIQDEEVLVSTQDVSFVALKNGEHSGTGYFVDSAERFEPGEVTFQLKELPRLIKLALDVESAPHPQSLGERSKGAAA